MTKKCKQCGEVKPLENFRKYYNGRLGSYKVCKACEKINSREKYLRNKGDSMTELDKVELNKIHTLYEMQRACGLQPPQRRESVSRVGDLDRLLNKYSDMDATPTELTQWLTCELTEEPEYYHDVVYADLCAKYRRVVRYDEKSLTPIYDETYKDVLYEILARFDGYEDSYYNTEE